MLHSPTLRGYRTSSVPHRPDLQGRARPLPDRTSLSLCVFAGPECNLRRSPSCSTSLRATLIPVNLVTVRTRIIQFFADFDEGVVISRLGYLMGELSHVDECRNVLLPVGAIHRDRPSVLTAASWRQQQRRALRKSNGGLIDSQPSRV